MLGGCEMCEIKKKQKMTLGELIALIVLIGIVLQFIIPAFLNLFVHN